MRLDSPFIRLPLRVDADRLAAEVAAFSEKDWKPHPQGYAGNDALSLIAKGGEPLNDAVKGPMLPTPFLARVPYHRQVLAALGSVLGRTRHMRIQGNGEATMHCDTNYYWMQRVRVHIPVKTYPEVRFLCGDAEVNMKPGEVWIFDTWRLHNVLNENPGTRIHLVVDTVGSAEFWELVAAGERPFTDPPTKAAVPDRVVKFDPKAEPELLTEQCNFPVVMSPWEVECLFADLVGDLALSEKAPPDLAGNLQEKLLKFHRTWRNLWSGHGQNPSGFPHFKKLIQQLDADLKAFEGKLPLPNKIDAVEAIRQAVVRTAVNPELAAAAGPAPPAAAPVPPPPEPKPTAVVHATPNPVPTPNGPPSLPAADPFDRPVFIVAAPRSGSTLLFETLAKAPDFWTIGGESHEIFEGKANLGPARHGWASNRLTAADAEPDAARALRAAFRAQLKDRDGKPLPPDAGPVRMLEKTPKNALRIPFLNAVFPDARFVYLFRDPRENVSSVIDAWKSGKFVTYPKLPGWDGPPWSLLLIPGWKELAGKPIAEIAAAQYRVAHEQIMDDLGKLPADRWTAVSYTDFLANPQAACETLCKFAGVRWDQALSGALPLSRHTLTAPDPDKWKKNEAELTSFLPQLEPVADKVKAFAFPSSAKKSAPAAAPATPAEPSKKEGEPAKRDVASEPLRSVFTTGLVTLFEELRISLLVSTYQAGKLVVVRAHEGKLNTHFRNFEGPMGMAVSGNRLAVGTKNHIWELHDQPDVAKKLEPVGKHDACYLARATHTTGDIRVHEIGWAGDELWIVNTRFSCLCTLDRRYSFVPRWRPKFVTALAPEDRCHLNGMCITGDPPRPKYVTCLGETDTAGGWRENKKNGGMLIDVETGEVVVRGLSMPHSPRLYNGRLWILESGVGGFGFLDPVTGKMQTLATLPGFTRGLDFVGPFAFIGLSQVRETAVFSGIPITETLTERTCGVWVVDTRNGRTVGFLRFEEGVQEIFAVQALPGIRYPDVITDEEQWLANSFVLPDEALAAVPKEMRTTKA
jgi:uncharacterized protein (TIGR03032 family)